MPKRIVGSAPCPKCDAEYGYTTNPEIVKVYEQEDGSYDSTCFHCKQWWPRDIRLDQEENHEMDNRSNANQQDSVNYGSDQLRVGTDPRRRISDTVAKLYDVRVGIASDGSVDSVHYPLSRGDGTSWKVRTLPKQFRITGGLDGVRLFGQTAFRGGGLRLVITEGEEDALAVAEAYHQYNGKIYPAVSIQSASNLKQIAEEREWIRSFEEIVLYIDNDEAGHPTVTKLAKLIGFDKKIKVAVGKEKDASDEYLNHGHMSVLRAVWDATPYNPQGILTSKDLWTQMEEYSKIESVPYPACFEGLNKKLKGMRQGEITLWTSGTGAGKSTMLREIAVHLVEQGEKIGIISLEESPAETAKKMSAMVLNKDPSNELTLEDLRPGFDKVFGDDQVLVLDHAGAITDGIVNQLQYMASVGCKYLFIDHITILVSEGAEGLTGNEAVDKIMNDLLKIAKTYGVWIGLVSHLRKMDKSGKSFEQGNLPSLDDIRGSGSIKQISMDIIAFARNSEQGENTIKMRVLKCRYTGDTGDCMPVRYDKEIGRIVGDANEAIDFD